MSQSKRIRSAQLLVYFHPHELDTLKQAADAAGMPVSTWARSIVIAQLKRIKAAARARSAELGE